MTLAALSLVLAAPAPVVLARKYVPGEKLAYNVAAHITAEVRGKGLETFIPEDLDISYGFDYNVQKVTPDGLATVRYQRPTMTETVGETSRSVPKPKVEKVNMVYRLVMSPVNELIDAQDISPKKGGKKKPAALRLATMAAARRQAPIFGSYIGEMHRLALFIGGLDSGLDFAPRLPLEAVKVGDTWKRTVGYQPQKLQGKKDKAAVQRLDYAYTYLGPMSSNGKKVLRVQAKLVLKSDLADYLKSLMKDEGMDESETNLKTMPLHLTATIDFDLDPNDRHTLSAVAASEGGFELFVKDDDEAYYEERFKGRTNLELVGRKIVPPKQRAAK